MKFFCTLFSLISSNIFPITKTSSQSHVEFKVKLPIRINIANRDYDNNDLASDDWVMGFEIFQDLTPTAGVRSLQQFEQKFKFLRIPNFMGEIYLFSWIKNVFGNDFAISLEIPGNEEKHWISPITKIGEGSETIGSAQITGKIGAQVELFEFSNHLILKIRIYVSGNYWSTGNRGHVIVHSGDLITLAEE